MMLSAGLHIYLRPRVTLNFDLLTPKLIIYALAPWTTFAIWRQNWFIRLKMLCLQNW